MQFLEKVDVLRNLGAGEFKHINGSLLEHLEATRDLLKSWGADAVLQDAGLYHAAYSTAGFKQQMLAIEQRNEVADVIGEEAENIVYHYCACDREFYYPALQHSSNPEFLDRFSGERVNLDTALLRNFCELTVANEIEIASSNSAFLKKHGAIRYEIYSNMFPNLSEAARSAVENVFGRDKLNH